MDQNQSKRSCPQRASRPCSHTARLDAVEFLELKVIQNDFVGIPNSRPFINGKQNVAQYVTFKVYNEP